MSVYISLILADRTDFWVWAREGGAALDHLHCDMIVGTCNREAEIRCGDDFRHGNEQKIHLLSCTLEFFS